MDVTTTIQVKKSLFERLIKQINDQKKQIKASNNLSELLSKQDRQLKQKDQEIEFLRSQNDKLQLDNWDLLVQNCCGHNAVPDSVASTATRNNIYTTTSGTSGNNQALSSSASFTTSGVARKRPHYDLEPDSASAVLSMSQTVDTDSAMCVPNTIKPVKEMTESHWRERDNDVNGITSRVAKVKLSDEAEQQPDRDKRLSAKDGFGRHTVIDKDPAVSPSLSGKDFKDKQNAINASHLKQEFRQLDIAEKSYLQTKCNQLQMALMNVLKSRQLTLDDYLNEQKRQQLVDSLQQKNRILQLQLRNLQINQQRKIITEHDATSVKTAALISTDSEAENSPANIEKGMTCDATTEGKEHGGGSGTFECSNCYRSFNSEAELQDHQDICIE